MQITLDVLRRFAGKGAHEDILRAIAAAAPTVLPQYGITTPRRMQQFFANIAVESNSFTTVREENLNYKTTRRLREVWPSRFRSDAQAAPFVRNPQLLANTVYANRMGNGPAASGDGFRFRGRSLPQLTGRDAYEAIGEIMGLPLTTNPGLICELPHILEAAAAFWKWKGARLVNAADAGKTSVVRKIWNGGATGLDEVTQWLARAERVFTEPLAPVRSSAPARPAAAEPVAEDRAEPVRSAPPLDDLADLAPAAPQAQPLQNTLDHPATPPVADVASVQRRLRDLGYFAVGVADGDMAGQTRGAIVAFKHDNAIVPETPEIDQAFLAALAIGKPRQVSEARANATESDLGKKNETIWAIAWDKLVKLATAIGAGLMALISYAGEKFRDTWEYLGTFRDGLAEVPLWIWLGAAAAIVLASYGLSQRASKDTLGKYKTGELL